LSGFSGDRLFVAVTLEQAAQALRAGDLQAAAAACHELLALNPASAAALQVLAMVHDRLGQFDESEKLFARSVEIRPRDAEFRTNLALLLAKRGRRDEAIRELERALILQPRFRAARLALARLCNEAGQHSAAGAHARKLIAANEHDTEAWSALGAARFLTGEMPGAREAFERAVALSPDYGAARYHLAATLSEQDEPEAALAQADAAIRLGVAHRELQLTRARALMQLDRYGAAEHVLLQLLDLSPFDVSSQFLLAQLRHVRGDVDFARTYRDAAARSDTPPAICAGYADTLRLAGRHDIAEGVLRKLLTLCGPLPELLSSLGLVLQESGRHAEAVDVARRASALRPDDATTTENLVVALLSAGDANAAMPLIEHCRHVAPLDQRWITYRADAARQRDESLYSEWCDVERFVRLYELSPPDGYATMEAFHAHLSRVLLDRHRQASHPLDQSLRHGTQTSRGLVAGSDPTIDAFLAMLGAPIAAYQRDIGRDAAHPLLRRNEASARLTGCWSVRLQRNGFHVNHIHPQGWISSAYYVSVPAETEDAISRSGWLKFGEPRLPLPGADATLYVQPRPGRLVLFPSYFWHGTVPIHGSDARLTVAFDAVPTSQPN
jgi:tetratricopeptide (TPR) repeat protein